MNPNELLRIVDSLHREKNIDPEIVFQAIEAAMISAAKKHYGEESDIKLTVDRKTGEIGGTCDDQPLDTVLIGRIGAQTAKQVIIQKIREAERDSLLEEFVVQIGQMVGGVVQRVEGNTTTVSSGNVEAILPRSEQIPGESHHPNERVRAIVYEVKPQGNRVKVILSRTATGTVREYVLRLRVRFRLRARNGDELIPDTELLQEREISFNETAALAKESEEQLLYRDMRADLVQQLIRRLTAVRQI